MNANSMLYVNKLPLSSLHSPFFFFLQIFFTVSWLQWAVIAQTGCQGGIRRRTWSGESLLSLSHVLRVLFQTIGLICPLLSQLSSVIQQQQLLWYILNLTTAATVNSEACASLSALVWSHKVSYFTTSTAARGVFWFVALESVGAHTHNATGSPKPVSVIIIIIKIIIKPHHIDVLWL